MSDLVSYYVKTTGSPGPAALYRRRHFPERGGRDDEYYVAREDTWREGDGVRKYEAGRSDWDFYGVHPDEAEQVRAWFRRIAEVGLDGAGRPPLLGEWSVGYAWLVELRGPLDDETVTTVLDRLGMTRRAELGPLERDLGLRVLHSDMECRWNFDLYRASENSWFLRLLYLRLTPDERVIEDLRAQVYALGLDIVNERVALQDSWPLSDRARGELRPRADWVLAMWFLGRLTEAALRTLHKRLNLASESGGDLEDDWIDEWGAGYLPNDSTFRAQLRLRRTAEDEHRWRFEIGVEGTRPPAAAVDQWRADIMAAATEAGLTYERDWLAPRPAPRDRPVPAPPRRTSAQVRILHRWYLDGRFTDESLREFQRGTGITERGGVDDDTEQFFGDRTLRDEENRLVRLMLARTFDGDWYLSLSYQDDPPDRVDQLTREIRTAAERAGLTVSSEWHQGEGS
jgi:hypothetical protein